MAEVRFTTEQQQAIFADNQELLISAAAGSGKTAVLVERILRLIREKHIDIDRMLVVTYTRAAAAELRERLELCLQAAAQKDISLSRQLDLLNRAQISTIHSYCQKVIKEHFRYCGVDPQFTMADERTSKQLYQESLNDVLDAAYAAAKDEPDLNALLAVLPEKNLVTVIDLLYSFLLTRPDPLGWMRAEANRKWDAETLTTHPMTLALIEECSLSIHNAIEGWRQGKALIEDPAFPEKFQQTISSDFLTLTELEKAAKAGLEPLCNAVSSIRFATIARVKPETSDAAQLCDKFKTIREEYKACLKELKKILPGRLDAAIGDMEKMQPATRGLCWVMEALHEDFRSRKLERAVLDFGDLEHMTLEILADDELHMLEASRFDAVFVDEYQDVSAIQEAILNGIKREDGSQFYFYVGDVKQSIYRFRQAEPTLFLSKLHSFSDDPEASHRRIILNKNFRSRETVLDSVNRVFGHVMDSRVTEIDYDAEAMLYPGKPSVGDPCTELHLLGNTTKRNSILQQAKWVAGDILRTVGQPVTDAQGNPGAPLHYRDIVILLPVVKGVADKVEAELVKAGIPVYVDAAMNAMGTEEVQQVSQHLMLLDNLHNDLALLSELRSPLFDMSERELSDIRLFLPDKGSSYLDALLACTRQQENEALRVRCQTVLDTLEEERFLYRSMPVEEYLWDFLMRSGLYAHYGCQPGGKLRQANLRMLCHKAGEYAQNHTEGLAGFLSTLHQGGDSTSPTVVNPWEDVVRIMTIHKSKGLEFPTVYLMGLEDAIQKRTVTKSISMHPQLGLSMMYMNRNARTKRGTLLQHVIDMRVKAEARAEKARVLYVAMTRPKNRLVLVSASDATPKDVRDFASKRMSGRLSLVRSAKNLCDWLLQTVTHDELDWSAEMTKQEHYIKEETRFETKTGSLENTELPMRSEVSKVSDVTASNSKPVAVQLSMFSTNGMWETSGKQLSSTVPTCFPQKKGVWKVVFHNEQAESSDSQREEKVNTDSGVNLTSLDNIIPTVSNIQDPLTPIRPLEPVPLKVGVTALCRAIEESQPIDSEEDTPERKRYPLITRQPKLLSSLPQKPDFLLPRQEDAALQRGVCTHLLLSTISVDAARQSLTEGNVIDFLEGHREYLRLCGRFTIQEASSADVHMAARFLLSEEGRNMLCSKEIRREWPFNLRITEPIQTMVQGVIDLCYLEEEEWVLIDFKTDYVSSKQELWNKYKLQLRLYRQALEVATGRKVRRCGLFSLRLGQMVSGDL